VYELRRVNIAALLFCLFASSVGARARKRGSAALSKRTTG